MATETLPLVAPASVRSLNADSRAEGNLLVGQKPRSSFERVFSARFNSKPKAVPDVPISLTTAKIIMGLAILTAIGLFIWALTKGD